MIGMHSSRLRFQQDTQKEARKAALGYRDELSPAITNPESSL